MNRLDNKGFTLVELLAVVVILLIIISIAIPTISSSIQRTNDKQRDNKIQLILSATELYLTDHRKARDKFYNNDCYIEIESNLISDNYITKGEITHNKELVGKYVIYNPDAMKIEVVDSLNIAGTGSVEKCS